MSAVAAAKPVTIRDGFDEIVIGRTLSYAFDPTGAKSFDEIQAPDIEWKYSDGRVVNLGFVKGSLWGRVDIEDARAIRGGVVVAVPYAPIDRVTFIEVRAGQTTVRQAGDHVSRRYWAAPTPYATFPVAPFESLRIFVRIEDAALELPLVLRTEQYDARVRVLDTVIRVAYFSLALGLWFYNLLLWLGTRLSIYGPYCAYTASVVLFSLAVDGTGYAVLWPDATTLNDRLPVIASGATAISLLLLQHQLLDLERTHPRAALRQRWAVWIIAGLLPLAAWTPWPWPMFYLVGAPVAMAVMTMSTAAPLAARGIRSAKLFLLAFSSFLIAVIGAGLANTGILDLGPYWTALIPAGSSVEIILFAYALADRIKTLQAETTASATLARDAAQALLVEQARSNVELQRMDKLKDEFLANTSHELRTPLHGMLGLSEAVLANPSLDAGSREQLTWVVASGRRLASLVNDILDFSKLRHQSITIREKNVDVGAAVTLALSVVRPMAEAKGLRLRSEVPGDVVARADENRLQQILTNLLGNAVKFSGDGEVVVGAERRDGRIFVSVKDSGIGIAKEAQARIFESFEQADGSTSREYGGTGLGLAVSKKLTELHGGQLEVQSAPGLGSTFTFDLAAADVLTAEQPATPGKGQAGSVLLRSAPVVDLPSPSAAIAPTSHTEARAAQAAIATLGHVLVADDDATNLAVLRAQLEPEGYTVTTARDGREAVSAFQTRGTFDAVLLDVMMPKMTGPEAAEIMRASHPHGTLPIVMLTAKSRPEDVVLGMRAGASDYLAKPFHREELLQRLDVHMQSVRTARAFRRFVPGAFLKLLGVDRFEALGAGVGQRHNLTVLFTDIRDFTTRSEKLGPEGIFRFINACLERFEPVVRANGGFVDKFIGDAVMAIFPGDPLDAVRAADGLMGEVRDFNAARPGAPMPLAIGIGIHQGPVILGTVGDAERMDVTVIGDAVNVAARLESLTKAFGTAALVSEDALGSVRDGVRRVGAVRVKGRREAVELFEVLACCGTDEERLQKAASDERFQRGLRAFVQGDIARAREHFELASAASPLDVLATLYLARAVSLEQTGLPEGFAGELV